MDFSKIDDVMLSELRGVLNARLTDQTREVYRFKVLGDERMRTVAAERVAAVERLCALVNGRIEDE